MLGNTMPDLTLVLDAPVEQAARRRAERGENADTFELRDRAFHEAVRQAFIDVARSEPERCALIDASRSAEDVTEAAWSELGKRFVGLSGVAS